MKARGMRRAGHVYAYRVLVGKPLGEPRHRWEDCIEIAVEAAGWDDGWIHLAHDLDK
jgi:hypothetical protein